MSKVIVGEKELLLIERIRELTKQIIDQREPINQHSQLYKQLENVLQEYRLLRGYGRKEPLTSQSPMLN